MDAKVFRIVFTHHLEQISSKRLNPLYPKCTPCLRQYRTKLNRSRSQRCKKEHHPFQLKKVEHFL